MSSLFSETTRSLVICDQPVPLLPLAPLFITESDLATTTESPADHYDKRFARSNIDFYNKKEGFFEVHPSTFNSI